MITKSAYLGPGNAPVGIEGPGTSLHCLRLSITPNFHEALEATIRQIAANDAVEQCEVVVVHAEGRSDTVNVFDIANKCQLFALDEAAYVKSNRR